MGRFIQSFIPDGSKLRKILISAMCLMDLVPTQAHILKPPHILMDMRAIHYCKILTSRSLSISPVSAADLKQAAGGADFAPNSAILFSCGWENWDSGDFLDDSPYLTRSAIQWLLSWEPKIIGSDIPAWQGPAEEDVFEIFSKHNSFLLAPLVNLKDAPISGGRLTVLTPNLTDTCCAPARAVLTAEE